MPGFASLAMINLDAADPAGLAAFYSQVLGWEVLHSEAEYAMIGDGSTSIGFGRVPGYSGARLAAGEPPRSASTWTSTSTTWTRPRSRRWPWARPSRPSSPPRTGGGCCSTRAATRSTSACVKSS